MVMSTRATTLTQGRNPLEAALEHPALFLDIYGVINDPVKGPIRFKLWDWQWGLLAQFMQNKRVILLKARQLGVSWLLAGYALWVARTTPGATILLVSRKEGVAADLLAKSAFLYHHLPGELKFPKHRADRDNDTRLVFGAINARIQAEASTKGSGRSESTTLVIPDEWAYHPDAYEMYSSYEPTVGMGGQIIGASTANGRQGLFYHLYNAALDKNSEFVPIFLPWHLRPDYTQDFREQKRREFDSLGVPHMLYQEYPENVSEAFGGSLNTFFSLSSLERLSAGVEPPAKTDLDGKLLIWKEPSYGMRYVIGCLPDGEKILTDEGWKAIETVGAENKLIDGNGQPVSIKNFQRRFYKGDLYELKPFYTASPTRFTGEHPIQVLKDTSIHRNEERYYRTDVIWKKVQDVTAKDILRFPLLYAEELSEQALLAHFPDQEDIRIDRQLKSEIILREDFWFFVGLWLAEGWIRNEGGGKFKIVSLSLNGLTEEGLADEIARIIELVFNRSGAYQHRRNVYEISFSSECIYRFLRDNFGQKAQGKYIAEWIKYLPKNLKLSLFKGYWSGDGCAVEEKGRKRINCVSVSERLLNDFQDILLSLGILPSVKLMRGEGIHIIKGKKVFTKKTYELNISTRDSQLLFDAWGLPIKNGFARGKHKKYGWIEDGFLYLKIHKLASAYFEGWVNNFETETHSYCTRFISTHNCDVAEGGLHGSRSAAIVLEPRTGRHVATLVGNFTPYEYAELLVNVARKYHEAVLAVENNNHGLAVLEALENIWHYPHLYKTYNRRGEMKLGWNTNIGTRLVACEDFRSAVADESFFTQDRGLVDEMWQFVDDDFGRPGAVAGGKDDMVMASVIVWQARNSMSIVRRMYRTTALAR